MAISKKAALSILFTASESYRKNLIDQSLLFLCLDKHKRVYSLEVTFDASNFKHLTGVQTKLSAQHFYEMCIDRRLSTDDFSFAEDGTTIWKMEVLPRLISKNLSANMLGEYNGSMPVLFTERLAGSTSACMGFVRSDENGRYIPNTILKGDVRTLVHRADRIIVTYRKKRADIHYSEIVYAAKKIEWNMIKLPESLQYLPLPKQEK